MKVLENYLHKHALFPQLIKESVPNQLGICIVLPACNELNVLNAIQSITNSDIPSATVELIVVINASENSTEQIQQQNIQSYEEIMAFKANYDGFLNIYPLLFNELHAKHAGVGLARKIGMDEAIRRFQIAKNKNGIIVCFDADCVVSPNYLVEVEKRFNTTNIAAASIYFEHPIEGAHYPNDIYQAIINYELHLRVYKNAIKWANLPYAFHTVGSSMAVRAFHYCQQGGMNKRKAGEDFYFLQKMIQSTVVEEINTTTVRPSPRISDRVPFGTGKAVADIIASNQEKFASYSLKSFESIKKLTALVPDLFTDIQLINKVDDILLNFYGLDVWLQKLEEIKRESASTLTFIKRFYQWFDAFQLLKFVHYSRDNYFPNEDINIVAKALLMKMGRNVECKNTVDLLMIFREIDKKSNFDKPFSID